MIQLLKFCNRKDIKLMPVHLPGSRNIQANALSHVGQTLLTELVVSSSSVLLMGNTSDRSVCNFVNRKLPVFASPFLDLGAKYVDAMPVLWDGNGVHPPTIQNATGCTQDSRSWWSVSDFGSSAPDGSIMDAGATQAVSVSSLSNGRASTSQTRSLNAQRSRQDKTLTTLKSTCMVALRDLFVKLIHSQGIADRMGTNLRASLIGCYESHWSRSIEYCLRKHLNRVGVNSIISTQLQLQLQRFQLQLQLQLRPISRISTPTPTPGVSTPTPTPTPANLQNINSNSNSNSGGFNSNSNSNSGDFNSNSNSNSGVSNPTPIPFQIQSILFN